MDRDIHLEITCQETVEVMECFWLLRESMRRKDQGQNPKSLAHEIDVLMNRVGKEHLES